VLKESVEKTKWTEINNLELMKRYFDSILEMISETVDGIKLHAKPTALPSLRRIDMQTKDRW
jgi:hypothetical protein